MKWLIEITDPVARQSNERLFPIVCLILVIGPLIVGIVCAYRAKSRGDRFAIVAITLAMIMGLLLTALRGFFISSRPWSSDRVAVVISIIKGYHLYYPADRGPIQAHIYGPFSALAFLPIALFHTPVNAILAASGLAAVWFFVPCAWAIWRLSDASNIARWAAIACFICLTQGNITLGEASVNCHADAVGIGLVACAMALVSGASLSRKRLWGTAILAVLAVWTKQIAAPIALAIPIWILVRNGRKLATRYLLCFILCGLIVSVACVALFGFHGLWLNMFVLPSHQPWQLSNMGKLAAFCHFAGRIFFECAVSMALLIAAIVVRWRWSMPRWMLPILMALAMLPTATLAWVKQGGDANNAAWVHAFVLIAACCAIAECESAPWLNSQQARRLSAPALLGLIALCIAWRVYDTDDLKRTKLRVALRPHQNDSELAYQFELHHKGEAYFPGIPLAPLLASGQLYHFDFAIYDHQLAGLGPSAEHFARHIPPHMKLLAFGSSGRSMEVMRLLPQFSRQVDVPELPYFTVYERADADAR